MCPWLKHRNTNRGLLNVVLHFKMFCQSVQSVRDEASQTTEGLPWFPELHTVHMISKNKDRSSSRRTACTHKHVKNYTKWTFLQGRLLLSSSSFSCLFEKPWPQNNTCSCPTAQSRGPSGEQKQNGKMIALGKVFTEELTLDLRKSSIIPGHSGNVAFQGVN